MIKWIKKLFKKKPIVYCVNCEHCSPDQSFNSMRKTGNTLNALKYAKCVAPQNIEKNKKDKALKLVVNCKFTDAEINRTGVKYKVDYCTIHRDPLNLHRCGKKGRWYVPKKEE